jgi:hypothetical protein
VAGWVKHNGRTYHDNPVPIPLRRHPTNRWTRSAGAGRLRAKGKAQSERIRAAASTPTFGAMIVLTMRGLLLVVISVVLMLCIWPGCSVRAQGFPDRTIHFVLPNRYVGAFRLVLDKRTGLEVKLKNGRYVLKIPASGTLRIRSFKFFAELHQKTAAYKNGKTIPYDPSGSFTSKRIALRNVWVTIGNIDENGEMVPPVVWTFMIGTKQQADKLKRRLEKDNAPNKPLDASGGSVFRNLIRPAMLD